MIRFIEKKYGIGPPAAELARSSSASPPPSPTLATTMAGGSPSAFGEEAAADPPSPSVSPVAAPGSDFSGDTVFLGAADACRQAARDAAAPSKAGPNSTEIRTVVF